MKALGVENQPMECQHRIRENEPPSLIMKEDEKIIECFFFFDCHPMVKHCVMALPCPILCLSLSVKFNADMFYPNPVPIEKTMAKIQLKCVILIQTYKMVSFSISFHRYSFSTGMKCNCNYTLSYT